MALVAKVGLDKSAFSTGLSALQNEVKSFSSEVKNMLAGGFAAGSIFEGLKGAIEKGGMLGDLAEKFGIAGSSLQKLGNSASLSGSSVEDVAAAMNKAAIKAQEAVGGNEALQASFAKIGLTVSDLASASPEQIMMAFADAMANGSIKGQEFALAVELMGKSATNLLPMLSQGSSAINAQGESMGVWSDETIANLKAADDQIKQLQNTFTIIFGGIASLINPAITAYQKFVEVLVLSGAAAKEAISGNFAGAKDLVKEINKTIDEDRSAKPLGAGGPKAVGEIGLTDKQIKEAEKAAKELEKQKEREMELYRQADAVHRRQMLNAMADEERLLVLQKERADLIEKLNKTPEGVERANLTLEKSNLDAQIGPLQTKIQNKIMDDMIGEDTTKVRKSRTEPMQILADSLQRVGGGGNFARVGGAEAVQKDQLTALKSIDKGITKLANQTSITGADTGVQ
jgi:hypothetical protein